MSFKVWAPNEAVTAWMDGRIHNLPDMWTRNLRPEHKVVRRQSFENACRTLDPNVVVYPEFQKAVVDLRLKRALERSTISTEVAGLIIIERHNKRWGYWFHRAEWMRRRGLDPMKRGSFRRTERRLMKLVMQVRRLSERRRFVHEAMRAMSVT
jgi:hypothetical protein